MRRAAGRRRGEDPGEQQAQLARREGRDGPVSPGMMLHAEARVEEAQVLGHLGDRGDGRLARAARDPLLDGDGGRDARQPVDGRTRELLDELPRVGRHRLHETALALGKHDVEGQRGLTRAGHAGDDRQLVVRNGDGQVLQVVLAGADDREFSFPGSEFRVVGRGSLGRHQPGTLNTEFRTARRAVRQRRAQKRRGGRVGAGDVLRRAFGDDAAALGAGPGPDLKNPVGGLEHVEVVLDDDHAVAAPDELLQHVEQAFHIVLVEAGGGLIEQEQSTGGRREAWGIGRKGGVRAEAAEVADKLEALGLAAAEGVERLAQHEIAEADLYERGQPPLDVGMGGEKRQRVADAGVEQVGDRAAVPGDGEHLGLETAALADRARHKHVGKELHLDALVAEPLAVVAAAVAAVE